MTQDSSWNKLVADLLAGDEAATREFHDQYAGSLRTIAESHISPNLRARFDGDDAVQSALRTFFRRAHDGEFRIADADKLWNLICAITLTKVREKTRFHLRQRRSVDREMNSPEVAANRDGSTRELPPDAEVAFAEECAHFLQSLDHDEARVVDLKLQNRFNDEIAKALNTSERTVSRILARLESRLRHTFECS